MMGMTEETILCVVTAAYHALLSLKYTDVATRSRSL